MSTSLSVAAALGADDVADAAEEAAEEATEEAAEEAATEELAWRASSWAGAAATRGAKAKRPLRMVDTLGMLVY
jgi:hypothetical protein